MSFRSGKSINAVIPYNRIAPLGTVNLQLRYLGYDAKGTPRAEEPANIVVSVTTPTGLWTDTYPGGNIVRSGPGQYCCAIPTTVKGTYIFTVTTDSGLGPSEQGQFEVMEET